MRIEFRTNLDEAKADVARLNDPHSGIWPGADYRPQIGERILFWLRENDRSYELEVVTITWDTSDRGSRSTFARLIVELHVPSYFKGAGTPWIDHMRRLRGGD